MPKHCFKMLLSTLAVLLCGPIALPQDSRLDVYAGIPPVAGVVDEIGGDLVQVHVLLRPGQSPHTFEPTPRQVMRLGESDLFLTVGLPFEKRIIEKIHRAEDGLRTADASDGIVKRHMESPGSHHDEDEHSEQHLDPHVWLSPPLLKTLAQNVARALVDADPEHEIRYRSNLDNYLKNTERVHTDIQQKLAPYQGEEFFVFHPAFGYFADAYGLKQRAVEVQGKTPRPQELEALIDRARETKAKVIFVQPQFDKAGAAVVADAIGGQVVTLEPLARDVLGSLEEMAHKVARALQETKDRQ